MSGFLADGGKSLSAVKQRSDVAKSALKEESGSQLEGGLQGITATYQVRKECLGEGQQYQGGRREGFRS